VTEQWVRDGGAPLPLRTCSDGHATLALRANFWRASAAGWGVAVVGRSGWFLVAALV